MSTYSPHCHFRHLISHILMTFFLLNISSYLHAQPTNTVQEVTTQTPQQAATDALSQGAMRDLAEKNALTVRALVGYGRIPASSMASLAGLRSKGINVLDATPDQISKLLQATDLHLSPQQRQTLTEVAQSMQTAGGWTAEGAAKGAGRQNATDTAPVVLINTRPALPPLPSMTLPPALPMVELGSTQYAGMITVAKEATRTLMGYMSASDAQNFENKWAGYYDFPSQEILGYFRQATPILSEFLNIREAIASTSAAFDRAWTEAVTAAQYDNADAADSAFAQADMLKEYLAALNTRGQMLAQALKNLGDIPDPVKAKTEATDRHKSATETLRGYLSVSPELEGIWFGAVEYDDDGWIKGVKGSPVLFVVYATGDPQQPRYRGLYLDASDYDDKENPYINIFAMQEGDNPEMPGLQAWFEGDRLQHTYEVKDEDDVMVITVSADRLLADGMVKYPPPVALDTVEAAYAKTSDKLQNDRNEFENRPVEQAETAEQALKQTAGRLGEHAALSLCEKAALDEINDIRRHNAWTPVFLKTARQWLQQRPFSDTTTLAQDRQALSALFAKNLGPQTAPAQQPIVTAAPTPETTEDRPVSTRTSEDTALVEAEKAALQERMQTHSQNILIIEKHLQKDREELTRETDPDRRAALEFRIVGQLSDLQSEKDLIASIKAGENVHTRSVFDDYAHQGFITNIRQSQRKIERFERSCDKLFKLAAMLPDAEGTQARDFVERQLTPEIRTNMDQEALSRIAGAIGKKIEGHSMGLLAQSETEAAGAEYGLQTSTLIKGVADDGMMVLSLFGGQYVDAAYQATTGYIEGGPAEAVLRTASMFGPTAGAAAEAVRGYREGGLEEAAKRGVISFGISKGLEYGLGKVLAPKNKGGQTPARTTGKTPADAPDIPTRTSGKNTPVSRMPQSADQKALEQFNKARQQGEELVADFQQAQKRLADAGSSGASAQELTRLQGIVRDKATAIQVNVNAKNYLKYKGNPNTQRAYNAHMRSVHAEVEARFHQNMANRGWDHRELKEFRNKSSAGSVPMDFDIGLDETIAGKLQRNGKTGTLNDWQQDAQMAWDEAFTATTNRNAEAAWENVTTSVHPESYKDTAWLRGDVGKIDKAWGGQTADVTRYKSWHMQHDPNLSKMEKLQEISRGAAKDMLTKLNPLLDRVKPTGKSLPGFQNARQHWNNVRKVLADFGDNTIDPITAQRRIRELTGGKSIPEVVEDMTYLLEGAVRFGNRS